MFEKPVNEIIQTKGMAGEFIDVLPESDILKDPKVTIGTVHSVKGGESDHVWLDIGTSGRIEKSCQTRNGRDDEIRVAYVAATRAKQTLGLLANEGGPINSVLPNVSAN